MKIWVLDSGLQGDRAQILGLAEAWRAKPRRQYLAMMLVFGHGQNYYRNPLRILLKRRNHERPTKGRM